MPVLCGREHPDPADLGGVMACAGPIGIPGAIVACVLIISAAICIVVAIWTNW